MFRAVLLALLLLGPLGVIRGTEFIVGADVSHLEFFEDRGVSYRENGQAEDALSILARRDLNCIRLRLFTSSGAQAAADPYNYINNLDYTLPLAIRAKNAGFQVLLDFHYSDTWADPGHQAKPASWTNLAFAQLVEQIRDYSSNTIAAFHAAGVPPQFVQVGNEISVGLLWPDGNVGGVNDTPTQWSKLGQLLKAAIQGIHSAAGTSAPKIILHIDRGGDWPATQWFFDHLAQEQVSFDIIGQSYYPFWHGSLTSLSNCLRNAAARYNKPVVVLETCFPWSNSTNIYGIPASPEGQVQYLTALAQVVKSVPGGRGAGIVWWGTEYQAVAGYGLAGFHRRSFFDAAGEVLPVADAYQQLAAPVVINGRLEAGELKLGWPLSGAGMILKTTATLSLTGAWTSVTNPIQSSNGWFGVELPLGTGPARYYRLESK